MKRMLFTFVISLCNYMSIHSQATSLSVDCQTPGWLSSMINYGDQQTVRNLKVTGYINNTDLYFIGSLFVEQNLKVLDLGDSHITGSKGDYWNGGMGGYESKGVIAIQKLVLPKSLKQWDVPIWLEIDSLIFDTKINKIDKFMPKEIEFLFLGENVDSIMTGAFYQTRIHSLHLPQSLKYIGDFAFDDVFEDLSFINKNSFPNLEYIGYCAFVNHFKTFYKDSNKENLPDTLMFPNIKEYTISCFDYKDGMHIFIGKDIETVYYNPKIAYSDKWFPSVQHVTFHIEASTPPTTSSGWNTGIDVYVPKDAVDIYKKQYSG